MAQTFDHPQIKYRKMVKSINHSKLGNLHLISHPVKYSDIDIEIRTSPPMLGEHTIEILKEYGYTTADCEKFKSEKVI